MNRPRSHTKGYVHLNPPSTAILPDPRGCWVPLPKKGRGARFQATQVNDFRPGIDRVVRDVDGRVWVVDTQHQYAPIQVWEPRVEELAPINPNLKPHQILGLYNATRTTPFLSEEGRKERLDSLRPHLPPAFVIVD